MALPTQDQIGSALARLGAYRVKRAQTVALEGEPDGLSGSLLLALGLKETWGQNIEGGAKLDANGKWIPEDNPQRMDVGIFQISRRYNGVALRGMAGVANKTWGPVIAGKTAYDSGFVPRFEESIRFVIEDMRESIAFAKDYDVPEKDQVRFAVAAHNAGVGGALQGWREGDMDKYTALGDYSEWVLAARTEVNKWLAKHPNWRVTP